MHDDSLPDQIIDDEIPESSDQPRSEAPSNLSGQVAEAVGWVVTGIAKALG